MFPSNRKTPPATAKPTEAPLSCNTPECFQNALLLVMPDSRLCSASSGKKILHTSCSHFTAYAPSSYCAYHRSSGSMHVIGFCIGFRV